MLEEDETPQRGAARKSKSYNTGYTALRTSTEAHKLIAEMSEELDITQTELMGLIIHWFHDSPDGYKAAKKGLSALNKMLKDPILKTLFNLSA